MFGLFLTILDIREGWTGARPWHDAIWSAAYSFVGLCGLGTIISIFTPRLLARGISLSQIAEQNRPPRQSFTEKIHADGSDLETGDESQDTAGIISSDKPDN